MALLAYLSQLDVSVTSAPPLAADNFLQSARAYSVPWCDVAVHVCSTPVPYEQLLYALNCSVVALCRVEPKLVSTVQWRSAASNPSS